MKVTIIEPEASGHRMILYVRNIAKEALSRGWELELITTQHATEHESFNILKNECGRNLKISIIPRIVSPNLNPSSIELLKYQYKQFKVIYKYFNNSAQANKPDIIFVSSLDDIEKVMSLLGSPFGDIPYIGMLMSIRFHHNNHNIIGNSTRCDWLYEKLFKRLLKIKSLKALTVIDEPFCEYVEKSLKNQFKSKVVYVPDPVAICGDMTRDSARDRLGITKNKLILLVYGSLTKRKGIVKLIETLADPLWPQNVSILIAGTQDTFIHDYFKQNWVQELKNDFKLIEMNGWINDELETLVFRSSDIVWLGYEEFYGMSGVLLQAGRMKLPIISCNEGVIGWLTKKYDLGFQLNSNNRDNILLAITSLSNNKHQREIWGTNGFKLSEQHTAEKYSQAICDLVESSIPPNRISK